MIKVLFDTSPLKNLHMFRGVGTYTDFLYQYLQQEKEITVLDANTTEKPDIVHYPYFDFFSHTLPFWKKTKTVITIHDVIPLIYPDQYPPGVRGTLKFWQQFVSLRSVSQIITDSECSKRDIIKYLNIPEKKVQTVLLAGNPNIQHQKGEVLSQVKKKYGLPELYFMYVGDINYNKNLPNLIKAFTAVPEEFSLVLVGRTLLNKEISEGVALHNAIQETGLQQRVKLLTTVPKEPVADMAAIFSGAFAYVQPSFYEGFGLPVLDAMQCEILVLSSNASSLPEVAGDGALYFDPTNPENIANILKQAINMEYSERLEYIARANANLKKFSWQKTARETVEVYKKVMRA